MTWLSLTPLEFAAVLSIAAATAVWLYLLHNQPKRQVVSTLRFWESLQAAAAPQRRRRIQHPWALLAQLLFLSLVILALANLRRDSFGIDRSVMLVVDGSVWSQAQPGGERQWMEQVRARALEEVNRLADGDRVAVMRADSMEQPMVSFTTDHALARKAITQMRPSDTTADLPRALAMADAGLAGRDAGTLVYIGPGMIDEQQRTRLDRFRSALLDRDPLRRTRLLVRTVGSPSVDNRGITRLAVRRDVEHPETWQVLAQVRNYSANAADVTLRLSMRGNVIEERQLKIGAGESANAHSAIKAPDGGVLEASINPDDALAADDRARAYLPAFRPAQVLVVTRDRRLLEPVLAANPYVRAEFVAPGEIPAIKPDVTIYDSVQAPAAARNAIEFLPGQHPEDLRLTAWNPQHPVTRWIHTRDVSVRSMAAIDASPSDTVLAWSGKQPLVIARDRNGEKMLMLAFDPRQSNLPLQPAFPLLLAASVEWMTQPVEEGGDSSIAGPLTLKAKTAQSITGAEGTEVPFAQADDALQLLATRAGVYNLHSSAGVEQVAVNVPPLPTQRWKKADDSDDDDDDGPPPPAPPHYYWRWFALLALLPLWAEWALYYRRLRTPAKVVRMPSPGEPRRVA